MDTRAWFTCTIIAYFRMNYKQHGVVAPLHVWLHLFHTCYSNSQTQTLCQHAVGLSHSPPSPNLSTMTFISHGSLLCCLRKIILSVLFQAFPSLVPRPLPDFISTAVRFISEWPGDEARPSPSPVLQWSVLRWPWQLSQGLWTPVTRGGRRPGYGQAQLGGSHLLAVKS